MTTGPLGDPDILRGARYMIDRYGRQSVLRAQPRRAELMQMNEHGGAAIWNQIAAVARLLLAEKDTVPSAPGALSGRGVLMRVGTSGQKIGATVPSSSDDDQATRHARKLFAEYPLVSEIEIRRQNISFRQPDRFLRRPAAGTSQKFERFARYLGGYSLF